MTRFARSWVSRAILSGASRLGRNHYRCTNSRTIVKATKLDGMFLFTDFLSHKTSAIKHTARQYGVPCIEAKMSRPGLVDAMRTWTRVVSD